MAKWTQYQEAYLRINHGYETAEQIGKAVGRKPKRVVEKAHALGLTIYRTKEQIAADEQYVKDLHHARITMSSKELEQWLT